MRWLVALLLLTGVVFAQSQQPSPSGGVTNQPPQPQAQAPNQPTGADQRGTEQSPTFVKIIPPPKTQTETDQEAQSREEKSSADWWMVRWTGAVALFTLILACIGGWQGWQLKRSVDLARDEFLSTHRPKIRVKHAWIFGDKLAWRVGKPLEINLDLVNFGDGSAKITWVVFQSIVLKKGEPLPQRPPFNEPPPDERYTFGPSHFWCGQILNPGITFPRIVCDGTILENQDVVEIVHGRKELYLIGGIEYWDDAGARGTTFCRKLTYTQYPPKDLEPGRFEIVRDPDYEFMD